jgi:hypothetical protein
VFVGEKSVQFLSVNLKVNRVGYVGVERQYCECSRTSSVNIRIKNRLDGI